MWCQVANIWRIFRVFVVRFWHVCTFSSLYIQRMFSTSHSSISSISDKKWPAQDMVCLLHVPFIIPLTLFTDLSIPQANPSSLPPTPKMTQPQGPFMDPTAGADSTTDESGHQLTLLAHHLGLSHAIDVVNISGQQDGSDVCGVASSASIDNPIMYWFETQDGLHSQNEPSELDLTPAFSCLSTLDAPVLLEPHTPPGFRSTFCFNNAYKYYVIVRGKCTSVYYSKWYVSRHESSSA